MYLVHQQAILTKASIRPCFEIVLPLQAEELNLIETGSEHVFQCASSPFTRPCTLMVLLLPDFVILMNKLNLFDKGAGPQNMFSRLKPSE